jgi:hypothetical protein
MKMQTPSVVDRSEVTWRTELECKYVLVLMDVFKE